MRRNSISSKTGDKAKKSIAEAQALINANEFFSKSEDSFDLPIKLNLDGNCLAFENNTWVLENSPENEWREKAMAAANEHQKLYEQYQDLEQKYTKLNEDSNLVQFKNQLLIEMLAVATLDEESHVDALRVEKSRSALLQDEMRKMIHKIDPKSSSMDKPISYGKNNMKFV